MKYMLNTDDNVSDKCTKQQVTMSNIAQHICMLHDMHKKTITTVI